jgi:hypothetical protein
MIYEYPCEQFELAICPKGVFGMLPCDGFVIHS